MMFKCSRKGQSSVEFIVLVSLVLLIILSFLGIVVNYLNASSDKVLKDDVLSVNKIIVNEIKLAKIVSNGYNRTFYLPRTIRGVKYDINFTEFGEYTITYKGYEYLDFYSVDVINSSSTLGVGYNWISKDNDLIRLGHIG